MSRQWVSSIETLNFSDTLRYMYIDLACRIKRYFYLSLAECLSLQSMETAFG
jgi:hypothetical protein